MLAFFKKDFHNKNSKENNNEKAYNDFYPYTSSQRDLTCT